jgi:hypothetical protein
VTLSRTTQTANLRGRQRIGHETLAQCSIGQVWADRVHPRYVADQMDDRRTRRPRSRSPPSRVARRQARNIASRGGVARCLDIRSHQGVKRRDRSCQISSSRERLDCWTGTSDPRGPGLWPELTAPNEQGVDHAGGLEPRPTCRTTNVRWARTRRSACLGRGLEDPRTGPGVNRRARPTDHARRLTRLLGRAMPRGVCGGAAALPGPTALGCGRPGAGVSSPPTR